MIRAALRNRIAALAVMLIVAPAHGQEQGTPQPEGAGTAEINLRKSVGVREHQGRQISGEERQIGRGDSLWRILVEEKGVPERRFRSYLVVIRGLNPQLKSLDALRVGERIFIPLRLEDIDKAPSRAETAMTSPAAPRSGRTVDYQVKAGEHLYRILRERFKLADERRLAQYYSLVKDLNPERKDWDSLAEGEVIRLPVEAALETTGSEVRAPVSRGTAPERQQAHPAIEIKAAPAKPAGPAATIRSAAREHIDVLLQVAKAIGNEADRSGEEVVKLPDEAVHLDKSDFPVIYNPVLRQRVVIDPDGKIPDSLKRRLSDPRVGTPVVSVGGGIDVAEAVRRLLAGVGYQPLSNDRPVVIQDAGVAVEARGHWVFLAPTVSNRPQEVLVVNLVDRAGEMPDYLGAALAKQGLILREVVLPAGTENPIEATAPSQLKDLGPPRELPKDRREAIDALLLSFRIPFGVAETIPVDLGGGLRVETLVDRLLEVEGKPTALLFRRADPVIRRALLEQRGTAIVEIDVNTQSSRQIIGRLLELLGDRAVYREHRFAAFDGAAKDRMTLAAWGFHLPERSMFLTDRQIPPAFQRFFFEKGLEIVYFQ